MPYIRESIVTTVDGKGRVHIAPIGIIAERDGWIIAPFRPSVTLDNLAQVPFAVANYTDDVRIFAGCLTGRRDWPVIPVTGCTAVCPCATSGRPTPTSAAASTPPAASVATRAILVLVDPIVPPVVSRVCPWTARS